VSCQCVHVRHGCAGLVLRERSSTGKSSWRSRGRRAAQAAVRPPGGREGQDKALADKVRGGEVFVDGLDVKAGDWLVLWDDQLKAACSRWDCVLETLQELTKNSGYTIAQHFQRLWNAKEQETQNHERAFCIH